MFGTHWSLLGHRTSGLARVALVTLSAFIFSTDYGNRVHSAVIVCSDVWAKKPVVTSPVTPDNQKTGCAVRYVRKTKAVY